MLSGLRLIFGGFCVALMAALFGLGLTTTSRPYIAPPVTLPARGALIEQASHPEWKQFLVRAALLRADELNRLSELPGGVPVQYGGRFLFVALPSGSATSPDDETGSITETPSVTIPIDIGATSSTELPVARKDSIQPPAVAPAAAADKTVRKPPVRRAKPAEAENTTPNLFEALFGDGSK